MATTAEMDAILQESRQDVDRVGAADLVLGIPTYNHREGIQRVVEPVVAALAGQATLRTAIVHADGGSKDGTAEYVRQLVAERVPLVQVRYPVYPVHRLSAPLSGVPGRDEALRTILLLGKQLGARVTAVLDADVQNITPEWIERLTSPVLNDDIDLVVPCYLRRQFDGMIHVAIVNPFARALYGKRLRQSAGADLAFSHRLSDFYSTAENGNRAALDPWSVVPPICAGFRIGQTFLGPRTAPLPEASADLGGTLSEVLEGVFEQMDRTAAFWQKVRYTEKVPWFGPPLEFITEPAQANIKRMVDSFRLGCQDLQEIWGAFLPPATLLALRRMRQRPDEEFHFPDDIWARTVYEFALGFHLRTIARDHLLQSLAPLYLGWVASLLAEVGNAGPDVVEERLERLALQFETQKRYLISRWRWPDRFNP